MSIGNDNKAVKATRKRFNQAAYRMRPNNPASVKEFEEATADYEAAKAKLVAPLKKIMDDFEANASSVATELRSQGMTKKEIVEAMNARGVPHIYSGRWTEARVNDLFKKIGEPKRTKEPKNGTPRAK